MGLIVIDLVMTTMRLIPWVLLRIDLVVYKFVKVEEHERLLGDSNGDPICDPRFVFGSQYNWGD